MVKTISRVCVLGIGFSVAAMIIVLNVMNGFNEAIHKRLLSIDPHLSIDLKHIDEAGSVLEKIKANPIFLGARFYPSQEEDVIFRTIDALFSGAQARGLTEENLNLLEKQIHISSSSYGDSLNKDTLGRSEVYIGEELARSLGVFEGDELNFIQPEALLLPQDVVPKYEKLKVKHIFRSDVSDFDNRFILYKIGSSFQSFQDSLSRKFYIHVYLKEKEMLEDASALLSSLSLSHKTWKQKNSSYLYALKMERWAMASFLSLTVIIASFTILMVLSLVIAQKRKDIAMLITIGLSPKKTQKLFTMLGFQLGAFGSLFGFLLGMFICYLLANFSIFELPKEIYYDYKIPVKMDYLFSVSIFICALLLSYICSYLPAKLGVGGNLSKLLRPGVSE